MPRRVTFLLTIALSSFLCGWWTVPGEALPPSTITTFAGTGVAGIGTDGVAPTECALYWPMDVAVGPDSAVYIVDWNNYVIRVVRDGVIQRVVGSGLPVPFADAESFVDGNALDVDLNHPTDLTFDADGGMVIAAWGNSRILRMASNSDSVVTIADSSGTRDFGGDSGPAVSAWLNLPSSVVFGPDGGLFVSDEDNMRIRRISSVGLISTVVGNGTSGFCGDGGPALQACLNNPIGQAAPPAGKIAFDVQGNMFIADTNNQRIRMVTPGGTISTVAGNGTRGFSGDGGPATEAEFNSPRDVAIGPTGNLFIADTFNHCIREIDNQGMISTAAGTPQMSGDDGDGGDPHQAHLSQPGGVAFDQTGRLYIADTGNSRIRLVAPTGTVPVRLLSFTAERREGGAILHWVPAQDEGAAAYRVFRGVVAGSREPLEAPVTPSGSGFECIDPAPPAGATAYWLQGIDRDGGTTWFGPVRLEALEEPGFALRLAPGLPNPFSASTTLTFDLPRASEVTLCVYDSRGRKVAVLVDGILGAGEHAVAWNGLDQTGRRPAAGLYVVRLETPLGTRAAKMTLLD